MKLVLMDKRTPAWNLYIYIYIYVCVWYIRVLLQDKSALYSIIYSWPLCLPANLTAAWNSSGLENIKDKLRGNSGSLPSWLSYLGKAQQNCNPSEIKTLSKHGDIRKVRRYQVGEILIAGQSLFKYFLFDQWMFSSGIESKKKISISFKIKINISAPLSDLEPTK